MTRALAWLLAAVLSLLAGILAAFGWRTLATLDDAWDIELDPPRVNTRVNTHAYSGGLFDYGAEEAAHAAREYLAAERLGLLVHVPNAWRPGSNA